MCTRVHVHVHVHVRVHACVRACVCAHSFDAVHSFNTQQAFEKVHMITFLSNIDQWLVLIPVFCFKWTYLLLHDYVQLEMIHTSKL